MLVLDKFKDAAGDDLRNVQYSFLQLPYMLYIITNYNYTITIITYRLVLWSHTLLHDLHYLSGLKLCYHSGRYTGFRSEGRGFDPGRAPMFFSILKMYVRIKTLHVLSMSFLQVRSTRLITKTAELRFRSSDICASSLSLRGIFLL